MTHVAGSSFIHKQAAAATARQGGQNHKSVPIFTAWMAQIEINFRTGIA